MLRSATPAVLAAVLLLSGLHAGCPAAGPDDDVPDDDDADDDDASDDDDAAPEPVWSEVYALLEFRCACHKAEEGGRGGLTGFEASDSAYAALVDHPSDDLPELARVEPGDPEASYLVHKVRGTAAEVGGRGDRMPPTGMPLPDRHIALIEAWIEDGAPP